MCKCISACPIKSWKPLWTITGFEINDKLYICICIDKLEKERVVVISAIAFLFDLGIFYAILLGKEGEGVLIWPCLLRINLCSVNIFQNLSWNILIKILIIYLSGVRENNLTEVIFIQTVGATLYLTLSVRLSSVNLVCP